MTEAFNDAWHDKVRRMVTYNLPLTQGDPTKAVLIVPADLTRVEGERIRDFITALEDAWNE